MECEYCKHSFSTKSSLNYHKKTARYCLKKQPDSEDNNYNCSACTKIFYRKHRLEKHQESCMLYHINLTTKTVEEKYKYMLDQKDILICKYEQTIQDLQNKLENIAIKAASRSTTTNNNTQINTILQKLEPITTEYIESKVPNLTIEHIKKGPQGYAEYALTHPFKDRIICVDYARRKIKYKDGEGNSITDPEMTKLATKLFKSIQDRNNSLIQEYMGELFKRVDYSSEVVTDMADYMCMVNSGARGEKSDLCNEFVKNVCSSTI